MDLSSFLAITQFIATCLSGMFTHLDAIVIINTPQLTFLDCIIVPAIMARLYMFYLFLMGQDVREPISSDPGDMFG